MTLVDTNILLDLVTDDSQWFGWSRDAMQTAAASGQLGINLVIYAELSARYEDYAAVDEVLDIAGIDVLEIPREAAFLASKAFSRYRTAGGTKTGVLSDFFIGAHAAVLQVPLLTRDRRRYETYFPTVRLIAPQVN